MNGCLIVKMEFENGFDLLQHVGDLDKSTSASEDQLWTKTFTW